MKLQIYSKHIKAYFLIVLILSGIPFNFTPVFAIADAINDLGTITMDFTNGIYNYNGTGMRWNTTKGTVVVNTTGLNLYGRAMYWNLTANTSYDIAFFLEAKSPNAEFIGLCDHDTNSAGGSGSFCGNGYYLAIEQNAIYKCIATVCSNVVGLTDVTDASRYHRLTINATSITAYVGEDLNTWTRRGGIENNQVSRTYLKPMIGDWDLKGTRWLRATLFYYAEPLNRYGKYNSTLITDNSLNHLVLWNTNTSLNFSAYNGTGTILNGLQMLNITQTNIPITKANYTAGSPIYMKFNTTSVWDYPIIVQDFYNQSTNITAHFYTSPYYLSNIGINTNILNNTQQQINITLGEVASGTNATNTVILSYNGVNTTLTSINETEYTTDFTASSSLIIETKPVNVFLITNFLGVNITSLMSTNQTITILEMDDCTDFTHEIFNATLKEERERTIIINDSSLSASFNVDNSYYVINQVDDYDGYFGICVNNTANFTADVDFNFKANGYGAVDKKEREHFYFNIMFNTTTVLQNFYKLNETIAEKIIFNVVNNVQQPLKEHYIIIKRWYGDSYETVAMAKTDVNGQAITYIEYNDPYYAMDILDSDGVLIYSTDRIILTSTPTTIQVSTDATLPYATRSGYIDYSNLWSNDTEYFTTVMSNNLGKDTIFQLLVYSMNGSLICNQVSSLTSSWTANCYVSNWNSTIFMVMGRASTYDPNSDIISMVNVYNYMIDDTIIIPSIHTAQAGVIYLFLIMLVIVMAFAGIMPNFLPLAPVISLLISNALGFTSISLVVIGGLGITGIIFLFWFMRS